MPPKSKSVGQNTFDVEYVNLELLAEDKLMVKSWDVKTVQLIEMLERLIDDGYKFSSKRDTFHQCVTASLTETVKTTAGKPRCLVSRGPDFVSALRVAMWKHYQLLDGDWGNVGNRPGEDTSWG